MERWSATFIGNYAVLPIIPLMIPVIGPKKKGGFGWNKERVDGLVKHRHI